MSIKTITFLYLFAIAVFGDSAFSLEDNDISTIPSKKILAISNASGNKRKISSSDRFTLIDFQDKSGAKIATLDKNWEQQWGEITGRGIISYWYLNKIRIYSYYIGKKGTFLRETSSVIIQVGDKSYQLTGEKNYYKVTPNLAYALKTAPGEATKIKVEFKDGGIPILSDIRTDTVAALRTIYQQAKITDKVSKDLAKEIQPIAASSKN